MDMFVFAGSGKSLDYSKLSTGQFLMMLRIIIVALTIGLLHFGLIAYFFIGPAEQQNELLTTIGLVVAFAALVLHPIAGSFVQRLMTRKLPEDEDTSRGQLLRAYQTGRVVSCALLEFAGFLNTMAYSFFSGQLISLATAGLLCLAILLKFPRRVTLENWMDDKLRESRDTRSFDQGNY